MDAGPLVRWSASSLVRRSSGPAVQRSSGPAVQRSSGPAVQRSSGPADQRTSGGTREKVVSQVIGLTTVLLAPATRLQGVTMQLDGSVGLDQVMPPGRDPERAVGCCADHLEFLVIGQHQAVTLFVTDELHAVADPAFFTRGLAIA